MYLTQNLLLFFSQLFETTFWFFFFGIFPFTYLIKSEFTMCGPLKLLLTEN